MPIILGLTKTIRFATARPKTVAGIAFVYDLEGFSAFVNRPDVGRFIPRFLNHVSGAVQDVVHGGYWSHDRKYHRFPPPSHEKFLGDGALYIWTATERKPFPPRFVLHLCNRIREFASDFPQVVRDASDTVPLLELPQRVRFGVASGDIYELRRNDPGARRQSKEYVGMCVNLASRLQNYCHEAPLSVIVSARDGMVDHLRQKHNYVRVIAKQIKSFSPEYVILDRSEYEGMDDVLRQQYFADA